VAAWKAGAELEKLGYICTFSNLTILGKKIILNNIQKGTA
jgi:hypothetical protein